jgi:hypothetical protein
VIISSLVSSSRQPLKPVEIKLSLKAGKLSLVKVTRHDFPQKDFGFVYQKASTMRLPRYHVSVAVLFNSIENGMQLNGELVRDSALGGRFREVQVNTLVPAVIVVIVMDYSISLSLGPGAARGLDFLWNDKVTSQLFG